MLEIHQGFSSAFSSHCFVAGDGNFPLFSSFGTFPLPKFIYIFVVIQILRNLFTFHGPELPLETVVNQTEMRKRTLDPLSNHITIERVWWFALVVPGSSLGLETFTSGKLVYVEDGGRKKGSANIAQDSVSVSYEFPPSIPDWTVINLNFKFSIRHTRMAERRVVGGESRFWRLLNCKARETHFLGKIKRDLTVSALGKIRWDFLQPELSFLAFEHWSLKLGWKFLKKTEK